MSDDKLTRGLGWLSLGLSSPALLTPQEFGQALGVGDAPRHRATAVVVGVQELVADVGLLDRQSGPDPSRPEQVARSSTKEIIMTAAPHPAGPTRPARPLPCARKRGGSAGLC
jgi:hypothetical protein